MKKKVNNNSLRKSVIVTIAFVMISVMLLSFGYARFSATTRIENIMAKVRPVGNAIISNFTMSGMDNGGTSSSLGYNMHNVYGTIDLPNQNSSVTFKVDVTVLLSSEMKIANITGLDSNLEYSFSNYTLGQPLCDTNNECNYGATDELYMTIRYKSGGYNSGSTTYAFNLDFDFQVVEYVAKIGNTRYVTLNDAIQAVPTTNVETTIVLLKNTSEILNVVRNQNIRFNLQNFTISNSGNNPIITNNGRITITNGTLSSNATQGAINNETYGTLIMSGGKILTTSTKQALFNDGGTATISGTAYLKSTSNQRPAITNKSNGTLTITGGTIISTRFDGIVNEGALTIGVKDGSVSKSSPFIQGSTYGINASASFNYYDGVIEGKTEAINDESLINETETGTSLIHSMDESYKKVFLGVPVTVTFNPNGGTVLEASRQLDQGNAIGSLPEPSWSGYDFDGWFTLASGGTEITENTTISNDIEIFAHWTQLQQYNCELDGVQYETVQEAVNRVPKNNTKKVIILLQNVTEAISIARNQYIEFNMQGHKMKNAGVLPIITNNGTLDITNGLIRSNATQGAINNESYGTLVMSGGRIEAVGTRQGIYNNGGNLTITGSAYISATTSERGAVHNLNNGTVTITGGTIVSTGLNAVENEADLIIGVKDGNINASSPSMTGKQYGVNNNGGTFKFYDGIIKGKTDSINGTIDEIETNSIRVNGVETIDGQTYQTAHLE